VTDPDRRDAGLLGSTSRIIVGGSRSQGWPVTVAAQAQGVASATADKWRRRWRATPWGGCLPPPASSTNGPGRIGLAPTARGSFNQTLDREWAYAAVNTSNQARLAALPGWLHTYNLHRPHSALSGRSPINILNNVPGNHISTRQQT
jgi:hypothetical protein